MITPASIARLLPGEVLRDDQVRGLQLRARASGKAWYLYYRHNGVERRPKLGPYPELSLKEARAAARALLERVARGEDPSAERQRERQAPTLRGLVEAWQEARLPRLSERSRREYQRLLAREILPELGGLRLAQLDRERVERWHARLSTRGAVQANRALAVLSSICGWAVRNGRLESNPCAGVERHRERHRERYLSEDELRRLQELLREKRASHPRATLFIELLLFTGARPSEVERITLRDLEVLPDGSGRITLWEHKTAARTGRPRVLYVPGELVERLQTVAEHPDAPAVGIKAPSTLWQQWRREAGLEDVRLYDLRHTYATLALSAGFSLDQIGRLLGHRSAATTLRYAHLEDELAREAAATVRQRLRERPAQ